MSYKNEMLEEIGDSFCFN